MQRIDTTALRNMIICDFYRQLKPRPRLTVSEWADRYRYLAPETSAEPGKWHTSRVPYSREIMDTANDPNVHTIVIMCASQMIKSEAEQNILYYFMHQDPCAVMMIHPTLSDAEDYSKSRIMPTIRVTPVLSEIFGDESKKQKISAQTILSKHFPGGRMLLVGANSPSGLASRPIRVVLADEIGRYETTKEGDAVELARKRQTTFYNRLLVLASSPGIKGICRIEYWYNLSDQRKFFVPCAECGEFMTLNWKQVVWDKNDEGEHFPDTARYACEHCGVLLNDVQIKDMVQKGEWRATAPFNGIAGFGGLNWLYSPWKKISDIVRDFLNAKDDPELLKVWVNTELGETWEEENEKIDENAIYERRETYNLTVPADAGIITAAVDVQDDRLEVLTVAWGKDEEAWAMEHVVFRGDPGVLTKNLKADDVAQAKMFDVPDAAFGVWAQLDEFLQKLYDHENGIRIPIAVTTIDIGGHHTDQVYAFVRSRQKRGVYAIKGSSERGKPIVNRPSSKNKGRVLLFQVGVFAAKEVVMSRLRSKKPGPGYMHFPDRFDLEFFKQLTSEKKITTQKKGVKKQEWVKTRSRNEGFDLVVYNLSALRIKYPARENLNALIDKQHKMLEEKKEESKKEKKQVKQQMKKSGFVKGWK